eukprot:4172203-Pleurochrysis_carterae.AAC.1
MQSQASTHPPIQPATNTHCRWRSSSLSLTDTGQHIPTLQMAVHTFARVPHAEMSPTKARQNRLASFLTPGTYHDRQSLSETSGKGPATVSAPAKKAPRRRAQRIRPQRARWQAQEPARSNSVRIEYAARTCLWHAHKKCGRADVGQVRLGRRAARALMRDTSADTLDCQKADAGPPAPMGARE